MKVIVLAIKSKSGKTVTQRYPVTNPNQAEVADIVKLLRKYIQTYHFFNLEGEQRDFTVTAKLVETTSKTM